MISTRRIAAVVALAAGVTGLAAPLANAADAPSDGLIHPMALIDSLVADGAQSLIQEQVEMGVAVRMAVLEALARNLPNA